MGLIDRLLGRTAVRSFNPYPDEGGWGHIGSLMFPFTGLQTTYNAKQEDIGGDFNGLVTGAYRRNGVVYAVELARLMLFAQARFQYQQLVKGRPGDLFGDASLSLLEHPWPGATTGDLLTRMLQDNDFAGDAFVLRRPNALRRVRPDWVTLVLGSYTDPDVNGADIDADVLGMIYHPGGHNSGRKVETFLADEFAHFCLVPDPVGFHRGIPWVSTIAPNVQSHSAATAHKLQFFNNGATVNLVVNNVPGATPQQFKDWVKEFREGHQGVAQAYKTLFLSGATTATPVGSNFEEMAFREIQGMDEVAICIAGGVPASIVGISEGLQGSSLNSGNYASNFRRFADLMARPAWQNAAGSLETIIPPPGGSRLWYDDRDIPALKDDIKDAAEVRVKDATALRSLTDAGWEPDAALDAITSGDLNRLKGKHTGLYSVQLQAPGTTNPEPAHPELPMLPKPMPPARSIEDERHDSIMLLMETALARSPTVNVTTPDVHVAPAAINFTIEQGAITAPDVTVNVPERSVAPAQVVVAEGAIRLAPAPETRTVIDRDPDTGRIVGTHEVPA